MEIGRGDDSKGRLPNSAPSKRCPVTPACSIVTNVIPTDTRKKLCASFWYSFLFDSVSLLSYQIF